MRYLTSQSDANAQAVDLLHSRGSVFLGEAQEEADEKWPLWWTALGLVTVCGAFWIGLFRLLF